MTRERCMYRECRPAGLHLQRCEVSTEHVSGLVELRDACSVHIRGLVMAILIDLVFSRTEIALPPRVHE